MQKTATCWTGWRTGQGRPLQVWTTNCERSHGTITGIAIQPTCAAGCRLPNSARLIVAHKEDFSRHNPIDRWWGGTHLTNDRLWRWNPTLMKP